MYGVPDGIGSRTAALRGGAAVLAAAANTFGRASRPQPAAATTSATDHQRSRRDIATGQSSVGNGPITPIQLLEPVASASPARPWSLSPYGCCTAVSR